MKTNIKRWTYNISFRKKSTVEEMNMEVRNPKEGKKQNISEFEDTQDQEVELGSTEEFEINSNKSEE
jgi:hypothetical protein